jgi:hypothetical protein
MTKTQSVHSVRWILIKIALRDLWKAITYKVVDVKMRERDPTDLAGLPNMKGE